MSMTAQAPRIGIVGLGSIGQIHAAAIAQLPELGNVVGVSRAGDDALRAARLPDSARHSVEDLLASDDVDVVAICTPSDTHADLARRALSAGKHVVVEKPFATDSSAGRRVLELAEARGLMAVGISQRRYEPQNAEIAELLMANALGRPVTCEVSVPWYRDAAYYQAAPWRASEGGGGGSLANQGLHSVDLALAFLGPVRQVTAQVANLGHDIAVEDTTVATLRFVSGALGVVMTTTCAYPGHAARLSLTTTKGRMSLEGAGVSEWTFETPPPTAEAPIPGGSSDPLAIGAAGHVAQWADILRSLRDGREPRVTGRNALHTAQVVEAIYRSAHRGQTVCLEEAE